MIDIIRRREQVEVKDFQLSWQYEGTTAGISFDCDENGNVDESKLTPFLRERLAMCRTGKDSETGEKLIYVGVRDFSHSYMESAVGKCSCGREVYLDGFTNTCECGCEYNSAGQLLADRSQWGEETGEHPADIARIQ